MERRFRLRHQRDFARVRREGRTYHNEHLRLSIVPNGLLYNRYGFITSRQIGNAVTRNRMRRLLREAVRILHPRLRVGYDLVLVARNTLIGQPFQTVERIVEEVCQQSNVMVSGSDGT